MSSASSEVSESSGKVGSHPSSIASRLNSVMKMDLILGFLLMPLEWFLQALAGILGPTNSPQLLRSQKTAAICLGLAVVAIVAAVVSASFGAGFRLCAYLFVAGFLLLGIAGEIGRHVETRIKKSVGDKPG